MRLGLYTSSFATWSYLEQSANLCMEIFRLRQNLSSATLPSATAELICNCKNTYLNIDSEIYTC